MKIVYLYLLFLLFVVQNVYGQIVQFDFEQQIATENWWRDNSNVRFNIDFATANQKDKFSKGCLNIRFDSVNISKPFTWFTDIKVDTFSNPKMINKWNEFKHNTKLSFWYKLNKGDTVWIQLLVMHADHKRKWGASNLIPLTSTNWTFVQLNPSSLQYENWGTGSQKPNFMTEEPLIFELGLRNGKHNSLGFIDVFFDDITLSN